MSHEILDSLKQAVLDYDTEEAVRWSNEALDHGMDPLLALAALTEAIRLVGDEFGAGNLWLPDLVGASETMLAAIPLIEAEIARQGAQRARLGTIVIGTVHGDLHNIGKTMVATLLTAEGFVVHDLGINVPAQEFVTAAQEHQADVVAMSALMTTTIAEQVHVIEKLTEAGLRDRVQVMVGGGGVTAEFAASIGADGYDATAPGAVKLARRMLGL